MRINKPAVAFLSLSSSSSSSMTNLFCNGFFTSRSSTFVPKSFASLSTHTTRTTRHFASTTPSPLSEEIMKETNTPPEKKEGALIPTGVPIAEGAIVSYFKGGLAAVRILDDMSTPATKETTSSPSKKNAASSLLFSGPPPPVVTTTARSAGSQGDDLMGRQVVFPNGVTGIVVAQRFPIVFCLSDVDSDIDPTMDGTISILDSLAHVSVGEGGVVDCFGNSLETHAKTTTTRAVVPTKRAIYAPIPKISHIGLINSPLLTGTTMVDALAPMGKGQNMLVVGSNLDEMRDFARTMLDTQLRMAATTDRKMRLVYAMTEYRPDVLNELKEMGLMNREDVTIVMARDFKSDDSSSSDPVTRAAEATAVAATACAIGEAHALSAGTTGQDALVIVDNINQHKFLWDATTRVMVNVYGVDAVVQADRDGGASSEMRAFYSSLIQRAARFKASRGDGSMTLALLTSIPGKDNNESSLDDDDDDVLYTPQDFERCSDKIKARLNVLVHKKIPLTAATLRKIDIPIPSASEGKRRLVLQHVDDLISMSDGQIWFDQTLKEKHHFSPPLDPQRSITRVGIGADTDSRADAPAIRRVVGGLRLDLAQSLAAMDGAEASDATSRQIRQRNAWLLAMYQPPMGAGRTLAESCVALLAASTGALNQAVQQDKLAGTVEGQAVMEQLLKHVQLHAPDAMNKIDQSLDMEPSVRQELEEAINSFFL